MQHISDKRNFDRKAVHHYHYYSLLSFSFSLLFFSFYFFDFRILLYATTSHREFRSNPPFVQRALYFIIRSSLDFYAQTRHVTHKRYFNVIRQHLEVGSSLSIVYHTESDGMTVWSNCCYRRFWCFGGQQSKGVTTLYPYSLACI